MHGATIKVFNNSVHTSQKTKWISIRKSVGESYEYVI